MVIYSKHGLRDPEARPCGHLLDLVHASDKRRVDRTIVPMLGAPSSQRSAPNPPYHTKEDKVEQKATE